MKAALIAFLILGTGVAAQDADISRAAGLAAWDRIYEVASHPRCSNCHVGANEPPMWQGLGYDGGVEHGMGVEAGESRIGAETIPCRTCHVTSDRGNTVAHAAPHVMDAWRLPPVELAWFGVGSAALCRQLRDPETNDGHDFADLVAHLRRSPFVAWGFAPGGGRNAAPGGVESLVQDVNRWGAAGAPCHQG